MKYLVDTGKPFKYMGKFLLYGMISISLVSVTIMQKNGAGLINACSCYWDTICDGNEYCR